MSIYKVDTESIIALSRLLHVGANAVDQTMRQSAAPALRKIVFQRGADVFATAQRLADALRRMNTLKNDLNIMGDALKVVAEEAYNATEASLRSFREYRSALQQTSRSFSLTIPLCFLTIGTPRLMRS